MMTWNAFFQKHKREIVNTLKIALRNQERFSKMSDVERRHYIADDNSKHVGTSRKEVCNG